MILGPAQNVLRCASFFVELVLDQFVALLKGVNVGGNNRIKNHELIAMCQSLGLTDVRTLLASGNIVFRTDQTAQSVARAITAALAEKNISVMVLVLVLEGAALQRKYAECPFDPQDGRFVHGFFCASPPVIDEGLLMELSTGGEDVIALGRTVWLHTPNGFGQSKVAGKFEKVVSGTRMTGRNLNTIGKLAEMLDK